MRLRVKRAHTPYPGVRLQAGFEMVIEPDGIAVALVRRGWFTEVEEPEPVIEDDATVDISKPAKEEVGGEIEEEKPKEAKKRARKSDKG